MPASRNDEQGAGLSSREMSVLLEISRVITSSLPLRNMFEVIHAYLTQIMDYKLGCLYIKEKSRFNLKVAVGVDEEKYAYLSKRAGTNFLLKKIKATGRPWRSSQILRADQLEKHPYYVQVLAPMGIVYTAGAPLRDGHHILGSVHLGRIAETGDFSPKEMQILEMVTNLLVPAIRNIRIKQISWQIDGVAAPGNGGKNLEANAGNNDEERSLELLGSVSSVMARELRNPVANLKMSFYSLARNFTSGVMAQQDLENMERSIKKMEKTISFLLNLSRDLNLNQEWVDVNELLDEVLQALRPIMDPDVVVIKDYSPVPKMFLDREKMHTVFGNIIENALDAMPGGGQLRIITTENQGRVFVILEDTGLGVNEQVRQRIFEPFVTTKPDGVGLGLTVCKRIIGSHGGKIKLRSYAGKGTAVCIDIPAVTQ